MEKNNKTSILDNVIEAQKSAFDKMAEGSKKLMINNPIINETIDKGSQIFKSALDKQKELFTEGTVKAEKMTENAKSATEQASSYYKEWYENQVKTANEMLNSNMNWFKTHSKEGTPENFTNMWQNWMDQSNKYWSNAANSNTAFQPFMNMGNMFDTNKNPFNHFSNDYMNGINSLMGDWHKAFQGNTSFDAFKGMMNTTNSFAKFYEMWMPMLKNFQDKAATIETFKQYFNMEKYKEFMNSFFSFMPKDTKDYFDKTQNIFSDYTKQFATQSTDAYSNFKNNFNSFNLGSNPYQTMLSHYTNWNQSLENAMSPLVKLMAPNSQTESMQEWKEINDMMVQYNMKNSEMQSMLYSKGAQVMEQIALNSIDKVKKGEEINSMLKIYQEWLGTSDKVFTALFNSDEYSKLMTEVSSLQMKIKKAIEGQIEKQYFSHLPIATRSEMDEVYQNLYDLKKQLRNLEKSIPSPVETISSKPNGKKK